MEERTPLEELKIKLRQFKVDETNPEGIVFTDLEENPILIQLICDAKRDVRNYRKYPPTWTEEEIEKDLANFKQIVIRVAMYDYIKEGADFESTNNENGEVRTYVSRESILNDILPFITAF